MKLNSAQLGKHLQGHLAAVYVVSGDDPLLSQEASDALRNAARSQGFSERQVFHCDASFDWSLLYEAGASLSLFAEQRLIELRIPSGKPGDKGSSALLDYLARPAEDTILLISLPKLDGSAQKTKWAKALIDSPDSVFVQIWPVETSQLPQWIRQRLAQAGLSASQDAVELIADRVEGNLLAAHQEIQKLALLHPAGELTWAQVESAVLNVARYDVFKLSEAVLSGQLLRVQRMLDGLQAEGEAAVLVHWALAEDIRALKRVKDAMNAGRPLPMALRENRIWGNKERHYERVLPHASDAALGRLLQSAHWVDGIVKGLKVPDWPQEPWQALQRLALQLGKLGMAAR